MMEQLGFIILILLLYAAGLFITGICLAICAAFKYVKNLRMKGER